MKKDMDEATREKFICWSADLDLQYEREFSIIDILEKNLQKWGKVVQMGQDYLYRDIYQSGNKTKRYENETNK